jgi:hypothetical protein
LTLAWENRGVAPAYLPYQLLVRLEGPTRLDFVLDSRNQNWLPDGRITKETYLLHLEDDVVPGAYDLLLKLRSPVAGRDVLLALDGGLLDQDGFYHLGAMVVSE